MICFTRIFASTVGLASEIEIVLVRFENWSLSYANVFLSSLPPLRPDIYINRRKVQQVIRWYNVYLALWMN